VALLDCAAQPATRHAACCAQEFVAELVAFTRKTAMMLFSPPLHKFPVPFVHKLVIHLVVLEVRLTSADGVATVKPEAYDAVSGTARVERTNQRRWRS
jgi:hypothetical protein